MADRFNTIIVNVGEGDFLLRAIRNVRGGWKPEQDIPYSEEGARRVPPRAPLVWAATATSTGTSTGWRREPHAPRRERPRRGGREDVGRRQGRVLLLRSDARVAEWALPSPSTRRRVAGRKTRRRRDGALSRMERHLSHRLRGQRDRRHRRARREVRLSRVVLQGWFQEASTREQPHAGSALDLEWLVLGLASADDRNGTRPPVTTRRLQGALTRRDRVLLFDSGSLGGLVDCRQAMIEGGGINAQDVRTARLACAYLRSGSRAGRCDANPGNVGEEVLGRR